MSEWKETTLGSLINVKHGWAFKGEFLSESSFPKNIVVAIGNFNYSGGFRFESTKKQEYIGEYPKDYELTSEDILLAMTCQTAGGEILGIPGKIPNDRNLYLHNQRLGKIEIKEPELIDRSFIYWLCLWKLFNHHLVSTASGTKILHTAPDRIKSFKFRCPPIKSQKKIGKTLDTLDAKIENLRRQNETLEAIAQTLFKHWFIDFEFPDADGKPYKSSGGGMWRSAIGEIPEGWHVEKLGDLTQTITKGTTPTTFKKDFVESGINFIKAESISESHTLIKSKFAYIDEETNIMLKRSIVQEKDILYTIAGTIGRYAMVTSSSLPANTNQAVAIIRPDFKKIDPEYLLCYFASIIYKHYLSSRIVQAVQANLSLGVLNDSPITIPEQRIKNIFSKVVAPIFSKKESNQMQIQTLTKTRDALLPKLMSGQLRVEE